MAQQMMVSLVVIHDHYTFLDVTTNHDKDKIAPC